MSRSDDIRTTWADPDMAEMEQVAAELGKAGNLRAIEVSRRLRESRGQRVTLALPSTEDMRGVLKAHAALIATTASGDVCLGNSLQFSTLLDRQRKLIDAIEYEAILRELEDGDEAAKPPREGT